MKQSLFALLRLYTKIVRLPTASTPVSEKIRGNGRYTPYWDHCIGAIDGTHIEVAGLGESEYATYRNRKGGLSQNVLAICNFELQFQYILAG
jgi:hypothetical protein